MARPRRHLYGSRRGFWCSRHATNHYARREIHVYLPTYRAASPSSGAGCRPERGGRATQNEETAIMTANPARNFINGTPLRARIAFARGETRLTAFSASGVAPGVSGRRN